MNRRTFLGGMAAAALSRYLLADEFASPPGLIAEYDFYLGNFLAGAEDLAGASWSKQLGVSCASIPAPSGSAPAFRITTASPGTGIFQSLPVIKGLDYTRSVYLRSTSGPGTVSLRDSEKPEPTPCYLSADWQRFTFSQAPPSTAAGLMVAANSLPSWDMWRPQLTEGISPADFEPGAPPNVPDLTGNGHNLRLIKAARRRYGLVYDGVLSCVEGVPKRGNAWTVVWASDGAVHSIDSSGNNYCNGIAVQCTYSHDVDVAGGYKGYELYSAYYDHVLSPSEHQSAFFYVRRRVGAHYGSDFAPQPVVTFIFDDSNDTDFNYMKPVFEAQGVPACSAVITNSIGRPQRLGVGQMLQLEESGWEILSHTKTHPDLTTLSAADVEEELRGSKEALLAWGVNVTNVAYPFGGVNNDVATAAARYYRLGRSVGDDCNYQPPPRYSVLGRGADDPTLLSRYTQWVDAAVLAKGWLIFYIHRTDDRNATCISSLIDYIKARKLNIRTMATAYDNFCRPFDAAQRRRPL